MLIFFHEDINIHFGHNINVTNANQIIWFSNPNSDNKSKSVKNIGQ